MTRVRRHLTYSNVVSTLCLFLLLGGGVAYAASVGSSDIVDESILSQDIKNGEVKNPDLGANSVGTGKINDGAVRTADVLDETLTAIDIAPESLGSGRIANGSLKGTDVDESSLVFACPAGFTQASDDVCFDDREHTAADQVAALNTCAAAGERLPSPAEAWLIQRALGNPPEVTRNLWTTDYTDASHAIAISLDISDANPSVNELPTSQTHPFICVRAPYN